VNSQETEQGFLNVDVLMLHPRFFTFSPPLTEATGCGSGFELARKALRPRGRLVLKSTYKGETSVNWSSIVVDEITILGSRCGPFAPALRLLAARAVDPTLLIAARYPLAKVLQAFEEAQKTGMLKVLVEM